MRKTKLSIGLIVIGLLLINVPYSFAGTKTVQHAVTVSVPTILDITADTSNFTLTFADFAKNSETDLKTVNYTVKANNMTKVTGVVTAQLGTLFTNIDLKADVGAYNKLGGTASLIEAASGFTTVLAASAVSLANRQIDSGTGKIVRGVLPITYKAVATNDLDAGNLTQTLTVSFIDT